MRGSHIVLLISLTCTCICDATVDTAIHQWYQNERLRDEQCDAKTKVLYDEQYRLQYHFSAESNWINDPCGLIYYDGVYHLFYQLNPYGTQWGNMHWGHASSPDLVHWSNLPIAIYEENGTMIFTGSSVYDVNNTSGFGDNVTSPIVAMYTGYTQSTNIQDQRLAFSLDGAATFTKYQNNPVIDIGSAEFRDPMVFWYEPAQQWRMVITLSTLTVIRIYGSPDMIEWIPLSDFGPQGETGRIWECPNMFELMVDGDVEKKMWVLELSVAGFESEPTVDFGIQYFVGDFNGTHFINDNPPSTRLWVEQARDFYAPASWSNIHTVDGRRVWQGWFNYPDYTGMMPVSPWRGSHTVVRELTLKTTPVGIRLCQTPVVELASLQVMPGWSYSDVTINELQDLIIADNVTGNTMEVSLRLNVTDADASFGIKLLQDATYETVIGLNVTDGTYTAYADTRLAGEVFSPKFPDVYEMSVFPAADGTVDMRIFVDWSSVEVFVSSGYAVFSLRVFPPTNPMGVQVFGENISCNFNAYRLSSIWS